MPFPPIVSIAFAWVEVGFRDLRGGCAMAETGRIADINGATSTKPRLRRDASSDQSLPSASSSWVRFSVDYRAALYSLSWCLRGHYTKLSAEFLYPAIQGSARVQYSVPKLSKPIRAGQMDLPLPTA